jgi:hypothetical protein
LSVKFDVDLGRDTQVDNVEEILTKIRSAAEPSEHKPGERSSLGSNSAATNARGLGG